MFTNIFYAISSFSSIKVCVNHGFFPSRSACLFVLTIGLEADTRTCIYYRLFIFLLLLFFILVFFFFHFISSFPLVLAAGDRALKGKMKMFSFFPLYGAMVVVVVCCRIYSKITVFHITRTLLNTECVFGQSIFHFISSFSSFLPVLLFLLLLFLFCFMFFFLFIVCFTSRLFWLMEMIRCKDTSVDSQRWLKQV